MKTRSKLREEEDEAHNAPPVRTPSTRSAARANSIPTGKGAAQSMLQAGTATAGGSSSTAESAGVTRKRIAASQARKEAAPGAAATAAAVATAAHTKQRRITRNQQQTGASSSSAPAAGEEETAASSSTGPIHVDTGAETTRELKNLIDYYPNAKEESRRVTRAQHRAGNSDSPRVDTAVDSMDGTQAKKVASPGGSRGQSGRVAKKASTVGGASSSSAGPSRTTTSAPTGKRSAAAAAHANDAAVEGQPVANAGGSRDSPFRLILGMMDEMDGGNLSNNEQEAIAQFMQAQYNEFRRHIDGSGTGGAADAAAAGSSSSSDRATSSTAAAAASSGGAAAGSSTSSTVAPTTTSMLLESMAHAQAAGSSSGSTSRGGARSAASNFIGNLVPRMQHLLGGHREGAQGTNARVQTILEGLKSSNEIRQQEAAMELADLLLMGNEDSLPPNLPIREIVTMVVQLLQKEHNFELMLTAARCLTNMLEALPRAQPVVIEAVPYLLEKLKRIECIDVAEQSLAALEVMSRRNGKNIMAAGGIAATISHIDFFPLASQRLAFSIASNCALFVSHADFHLVRDSLAELTQRMINGACAEDKRCLDSICTLFARLIENLRSHPDKLREVAGSNHALLSNMQQLLLAQPSLLSSQTFPLVVKSVRTMAAKCSDIAVALIDNHFATTLRQLFIGHGKRDSEGVQVDIVSRPANQLAELVYLTGELFPRLPTTGIFEIDSIVAGCNRENAAANKPVVGAEWFWRDDDGMWQSYRSSESRMLESARASGQVETHLSAGGNVYLMDLTNMRQTNTLTGTTRELMRRAPNPPPPKKEEPVASSLEEDARLVKVQSDGQKMESVARLLFPVLVEIDGSSVGPALRYESLRVMLRIVCPTPTGVLRGVLADLPLSGHIASALASQRSKDVCVVVAALQLVHMLLEKMADVYGPLFRKEGVSHEVAKLAAISLSSSAEGSPSSSAAGPSTSKSAPPSGVASPALGTPETAGGSKRGTRRAAKAKQSEEAASSSAAAAPAETASSSSTSAPVTRSNRQRKRNSPDASPSSSSSAKEKSRRKSSSSNFLSALRLPSFRGSPSSGGSSNGSPSASAAAAAAPSASSPSAASSSAVRAEMASIYTHYSSQLTAASMRRATGAVSAAGGTAAASASVQLSSVQKENIRAWIKKEAELLMKTYLGEGVGVSSTSMAALEECAARLEGREEKGVEELYQLLQKEQLSAFEMKQSGVIGGLHTYLTSLEGGEMERRRRLVSFARVFMKIDEKNGEGMRPTGIDGSFEIFEAIVQKTLASVSLLEQFQVSDMGGIATGGVGGCLRGAQALRFFQTHQIRCNLRRHPACRDLSDWRHGHGSIKVDPLTSISAIERYLSERGIGYVRNPTGGGVAMEDSSGEDELSDEDGEGAVMGGGTAGGAGAEEKKIEIVIGDTALPGSISILQALRQYAPLMQEEGGAGGAIGQNLWMSTHTLYYRSVVPREESTQGSSPSAHSPNVTSATSTSPAAPVLKDRKQKVADKLWIEGEVEVIESPLWSFVNRSLPVEMEDPCASSLQLLRALYGLNKYWFALFDMDAMLPSTFAPIIPTSSFVCSKLSAKLQRQLSDFISVATQQIPKWTTDLVKATPFIFPFAMRRSLLYCTAFGRDRALMHLVNSTDGGGGADSHETGRGLTPRLERKKVSIKRDELIKSAEAALIGCSGHRAMLEVSFEGEAGTGFGPTLEFYSAISKELQLASLKLWSGSVVKGVGEDIDQEFVSSPYGLHPNAVAYGVKSSGGSSRVKKFELIGRLMAQSLIDARMLDLPLSPLFHSWLIGDQARVGLPELEMLDPQLYKSLRALTLTDEADFEHLEQYFTLPGNEAFELIKGGKNKPVTKTNVIQYVKLVVRWRLREGVAREMEAMRRGFCSIVDSTHLSIFTADELDQLLCGCPDDAGDKVWGAEAIAASIKPDHGYSHDSDQIKWLVQMLSSFNKEEQRRFIQFCTGSPRLPVGGFRALNPPLTIVRKSPAYGSSDEELPSAMTCYNYLKVPPYSSYEIFFERFTVALQFVTSFHLT
ncbi:hypothetical protein PMAYCL1PPCAC_02192 [Pristionchus mayeri]|uniref:E3 ubiquitin-protein ligase n=1 Tax=Pristionchus mayeri TaxID=1317129 RepID=A0AAN5C6Q5_9BILA|nr:hypothetical protein PMAYCL1PPCAC_02192 [Pristionchus mayeri]